MRRTASRTARLKAADAGVLDAAVIAPFAGVVYVRLALLDQLAVAAERVHAFRAGDVDLGRPVDAGVAVGPLDDQAFLFEQALLIGHQLGEALEGRRRLQHQFLHIQLRTNRWTTFRLPRTALNQPAHASTTTLRPL